MNSFRNIFDRFALVYIQLATQTYKLETKNQNEIKTFTVDIRIETKKKHNIKKNAILQKIIL